MRRKGKIHPSPSSSATSNHPFTNKNSLAILKLLPAAILAIVSVLSVEDSQVLAYMISRSIKATNPDSSDYSQENWKKNSKKLVAAGGHKPPDFDCECFDCYTSYWFKWDSSPNRELIHQAIEAFEEHLNEDEHFKKGKNKKKYKVGRRGIGNGKIADNQSPEFEDKSFFEPASSETIVPQLKSSELIGKASGLSKVLSLDDGVKPESLLDHEVVVPRGGGVSGANNHKGLARKLLPDLLGLFNWRLWSLWSPNV